MDKVELVEIGADSVSVGVCGPKAESVLLNAGINASGMQPLEVRDVGFDDIAATLVRGPEQKPGWFELWLGSQQSAGSCGTCWSKPVRRPVGAEALEMWRVLHGHSQLRPGHSRSRPAAGNRTAAGAELHQRMLHWPGDRGAHPLARAGAPQVYWLSSSETASRALGKKYESEGRALAEITSIARVPATGRPKESSGLGYVRREATGRRAED